MATPTEAAVVGTSDFRLLSTTAGAKITGVHESLLQECEKDIIWYRENFFGKAHQNYLAVDSTRGPLAISVVQDNGSYKALVRSIQGSERLTVPVKAVPVPWWRAAMKAGPTPAALMAGISRDIPVKSLKLCKGTSVPNELLAMEERQVIRSYKFGLVYVGPGQATEEEMFLNRHENTSPAFKQFLSFLGETIELRGWKGYRAGLDISGSNNTGTQSLYTKWQGYEIMFHVSTFLPFNDKDKQQLERKRHIGNDIVVVLFSESELPFQLSTITSQQNHVIAIVQPANEGYRLTMATKNGVPAFTPDLPEPTIFDREPLSRDFLLHKLVNGERASYKAPSFAPKISRTRSVLLYDVASKHAK
ncbi:hypothetical protein DFJ73DRAFT_764253 [Zopfochytrium polystomum]|nr:hypothetical protein DFJ73DRAFT_764253 [Zopfochytrium polystomum]